MEILFVSCGIGLLDKTDSGAAQRSTLFVTALSKIGHVDVISFYNEKVSSNIGNCDVIHDAFIEDNPEETGKKNRFDFLRYILKPLNPYSYYDVNSRREALIDDFIARKNYDLIACRYIPNAITCGLLKYSDRLVIDTDDNIVTALRRDDSYANVKLPHRKFLRWLKARRAGRMAESILSKVRKSFYSNILEPPYEGSVFLHNTTSTQSEMPGITPDTPLNLLVLGWMSFPPNYYGVKHFAEAVLPIVRDAFPSAELHVAGKFDDDEKRQELGSIPGVRVLGFVDDIISEYRNSRVVVVPLYHGSGTSVKFIEGAAMKRPIVSSPAGARGLDYAFTPDEDYFMAEDDKAFADKIISLLKSQELSNEMAEKAFSKVTEHFSREKFYETVKISLYQSGLLNAEEESIMYPSSGAMSRRR